MPDGLGGVDERLGEHVAVRQLGERERAFGAARERTARRRPTTTRCSRPPPTRRSRPADLAAPSSRSSPPSRRACARAGTRPRGRRARPVASSSRPSRRRCDRGCEKAAGILVSSFRERGPASSSSTESVGVLGETRREDAARRPAADDDDVVHAPRIGRDDLGTKPCPTRDGFAAYARRMATATAKSAPKTPTAATPWGAAALLEEATVPQRVGDKRFSVVVQLLEAPGGERLIRFAYTTDGIRAARSRHDAGARPRAAAGGARARARPQGGAWALAAAPREPTAERASRRARARGARPQRRRAPRAGALRRPSRAADRRRAPGGA